MPLLVGAGHTVAGMTRTPAKAVELRELGAPPVVCDVVDLDALRGAVTAFHPELVMHQLTARRRVAHRRLRGAQQRGDRTRAFERHVLDAGGVVIRYGQLYGPGTYYPGAPPPPPRVHVDEAATATIPLLDAKPGIVEVVESNRPA